MKSAQVMLCLMNRARTYWPLLLQADSRCARPTSCPTRRFSWREQQVMGSGSASASGRETRSNNFLHPPRSPTPLIAIWSIPGRVRGWVRGGRDVKIIFIRVDIFDIRLRRTGYAHAWDWLWCHHRGWRLRLLHSRHLSLSLYWISLMDPTGGMSTNW